MKGDPVPQFEEGQAGPRMRPLRSDPEVLVVGGGPAGCAAALAHARNGALVLLIEAQHEITQRLAGEWLHPSAVAVIRRLGIDVSLGDATRPAGRGFVVFPDDDQGPIVLNYAQGRQGMSCHHGELVATLRAAAASHPGIQFVTGVRVGRIEGQIVTLAYGNGTEMVTVLADRIVGADGRASATRRCIGLANECTLISHMAGLVLENAELPFEGYGHVFLGGPGPMFVFRLDHRRIRVCLDVPVSMRSAMQCPEAMGAAYRSAIPVELRPSFDQALRRCAPTYASNQWQSRVQFGRKGLALVGDAVGHFHPLTAAGLTLGLQDGYCLAASRSISDYGRRRAAERYIPELLASSLYQLFTRSDAGTLALRSAVFATWRENPAERSLAMRLLACDETRTGQFHHAFLKPLSFAFRRTVTRAALTGKWRAAAATLNGFGSWLHWLVFMNGPGASACPRPVLKNI